MQPTIFFKFLLASSEYSSSFSAFVVLSNNLSCTGVLHLSRVFALLGLLIVGENVNKLVNDSELSCRFLGLNSLSIAVDWSRSIVSASKLDIDALVSGVCVQLYYLLFVLAFGVTN